MPLGKLLSSTLVRSVLLAGIASSALLLGGVKAEAASLAWQALTPTQDCARIFPRFTEEREFVYWISDGERYTVPAGYTVSGPYERDDAPSYYLSCGPVTMAALASFFAASDKDIYAPGETATVSVAATIGDAGGSRNFFDYIFNPFCIFGCSSIGGVGASATYINTIVYCDASGSCSNTGSFRVPTRPGTYAIVLNGCVPGTCAPSSLTFTVSAAAAAAVITPAVVCATNQGASCQSAANSCGQTQADGTVQCDGSCSSTPPSSSSCPSDLTTATPVVSPAFGISVGQGISFSSLISNSASGSTNGSFPNLFRINTSSLIDGSSIGGLAAGASANTTASFTPTSAGSYVVSACADNTTGWQGSIAESNEGNNCSGDATFTVTPCTASLSPSSVTIEQGQSTTLSWAPSSSYCGISSCTFADGVSYGGGSGSRIVSPLTTSTYGLSCVGPYNPAPGTPPVYATIIVLVPTATLTANGQSATARVNPGTANNTTIAWASSNATACTVTKNGVAWRTGLSSAGTQDTVIAQTVYAIDCVNNYGVHTNSAQNGSVRVNIIPAYQEF